jgi:hypothetical protein
MYNTVKAEGGDGGCGCGPVIDQQGCETAGLTALEPGPRFTLA